MSHKIGDRVGAILRADKERVEFLGYGTYQGDHVPTDVAGPLADVVRSAGLANPKIILDNGDVVWGCECWWDHEKGIRDDIERRRDGGAEIIDVRIADVRANS